ncbi:integrase, catalytic region, zinc finger, CCHC-type containing protein [Tanacetum coccineum]
MKWFGYSHLEEIIVRRQDDQLYNFREGEFKRLRRQNIKDMLLLLVQDKLTNLNLEERYALNVALRMFTRHEMNRNCLMCTDELHKFCDGTLNHVRTALNDIALGIETRSKYENKGRVSTEMELILEQTQQGISHEVSVDPHGFEGIYKDGRGGLSGIARREATILMGLPKDIYAAVDSCETAQEIWLHVQQMMKASDIGIQEKKCLILINDFKRNKHFLEKIASYLKFLNNLQPEWSRHVTIVHQTKDLHEVDFTHLYDFLKYNQVEVERLARAHDPLALMANSNNPYNYPVFHQDQPSQITYMQQPQPNDNYLPQPSFNQNYMQQPMLNPKDISDPTNAMNIVLVLIAKAFKLNYSKPTNNNQRILSNYRNRQIAQPGHYARNCTAKPRKRDVAQTQLLIAQKEEAGIQLQAEEYDFMAVAGDLEEIEEVSANCILMANLQQASTSVSSVEQAAKLVQDFKYLANEAGESLAKHKALEFEIERLLRELEDKFVPINQTRASIMTNLITVSEPHVITKKGVNSNSNDLSSTRVDNTAKTRRPQPRSNIKNDRVPSASKSSCIKNKEFLGTVHFGHDHIAAILGYGDLQWGNILITTVYFVNGLGYNLFSVGQFCDSDLEVAFRRNTCFVRNLEGLDLLKGNRTTNLYTINLYEMASASPICLIVHATSTKSKDEAPEEIKTFLKKITILLQAPVIIVIIDNGTKFKNQFLKQYFDSVGISHQASSVR